MLAALILLGTFAQTSGEHVKAELVTSVTSAQPGKAFLAAVILRTDPGWHVYWMNPGDAGTATKIAWNLPPGWTAGETQWPIPNRFNEKELVTYGYEGSTMLLARITPATDAKLGLASFTADVTWTAAKDTRIPGKSTLRRSLSVQQKDLASRNWNDKLTAAEGDMPRAVEGWKFAASPIEGGWVLKATPPKKLTFDRFLPSFYPADAGIFDHAWPQRLIEQEDGSFWIGLKKLPTAETNPTHIRGLLMAPKGSAWEGAGDAMWVDAPVTAS
jgi:thiol:disulfide interchange protein DsbD